MKKAVPVLLAVCLIFSLCACRASDMADRGTDDGMIYDGHASDGVIDRNDRADTRDYDVNDTENRTGDVITDPDGYGSGTMKNESGTANRDRVGDSAASGSTGSAGTAVG